MSACTYTASFEGAQAHPVQVQVQLTGGTPAFIIVGLADKAVGESRERVRAAFAAIGLAIPSKRVIINLAPADRPKEGSHYDLPIAIGLMAAMGVLPPEAAQEWLAMGELGLDGSIAPVPGLLPGAMLAHGQGYGFICGAKGGAEAAWAGGDVGLLAPASLIQLVNHFKGRQVLTRPVPGDMIEGAVYKDLRDVRGQETAKRALEIAAAGGHNLLFVGPPGAGKSMLAERLPGILPPLSAQELLDVSTIQSVAGLLDQGRLTRQRPFRAPHHSASMAALVGGGNRIRPGEVSLAHNGVLFLDELPEFHPQVLDSLRQPLESGQAVIARANGRFSYPARFQLIAAMNPCRCGWAGENGEACARGAKCAETYQARVSGPLMDRIDLQLDIPPVTAADLALPPSAEGTAEVAARVLAARAIQDERGCLNAQLSGDLLDRYARPDEAGAQLLNQAAQHMGLSARGYHRVLRVARTLADLEGGESVRRIHIAEALSNRRAKAKGQAIARPLGFVG
ncbi:YifB family Mg chelatase-like AAA ATPase [Woodsholea maritima]|uniref:YifB family Mg chelatase-like AAA ATPase n=1 Tax=Woodsholea maritima TaxID=240237 RepID=UPI0003781B16|nr:YifB family Mg chelatase-like AAA ATPase [Woodsholea maritima]